MIPTSDTALGRTARTIRPVAEMTAAVALAVAGVAAGSARADVPSTTVVNMRLSGPGASGRAVVVRAVDSTAVDGPRMTEILSTGTTARDGSAVMRVDPAGLAYLRDDAGYVNFESQVQVGEEPRFTSFSRRWTGSGWVDPEGRPAEIALPLSTAAPELTAGGAPAVTTLPSAKRPAPKGEVDCVWYDDSAANADTVIGEFHTGANTKGHFTYGTTSDSDISVGYNYGRGWSVGGTGHVGNSRATYIRFNVRSNFHHQLKTTFRYIHWHLTLGPSCASSKRWGEQYQKVTPSSWQSGSEIGAKVGGTFCKGAEGRRSFAPGSDFYRGSRRSYTYGSAAKAWGASLSATSGYSKFVDMNYRFGDSKKAPHYLCGRPDILSSKIIYAR
jgi:hypothetical protein